MEKVCVLILAAGEGKRMKSKTAKVLNKIMFKPMIDYVIDAGSRITDDKITVIAGHKKEDIINYLGNKVNFAFQEEQKGTGHAVMMAKDIIVDSGASTTVVLNGDMPQITGETLEKVLNYHNSGKCQVTVVGASFEDPTGYGRLVISGSELEKIVEHKDCNEKQLKIKEINAGIYFFDTKYLLNALKLVKNDNAQGEYYLTDTIEIIKKMGGKAGAFIVENKNEIAGCNNRFELSEADKSIRMRINRKLMEEGVTIINPENTYIGENVRIGQDTVVYPGVVIKGNTVIGEDCEITSDSRIEDSEIGNNVNIAISTIISSKVGNNVNVGPYAYIRPDSEIGNNVKIGDFVEVKKSKIDEGTKVAHLTYIGDAEVGKNVNFGCGTVVVNYDGIKKHKTIIGDNVFVGCNTNLVSPVKVGNDTFIAAGSTITDEIPDNAFSIARARQVNKEGWVKPKDR